jgi:hypothetical protein
VLNPTKMVLNWSCISYPIGSMVLLWCAMDPINKNPLYVSINIPAPWILWLCDFLSIFPSNLFVDQDMNECDRRDVGMFVIIATGVTARHCRRLGQGPGKGMVFKVGQKWINAMGIRPSLSNGSSQATKLIKLVNCAKKIRHWTSDWS